MPKHRWIIVGFLSVCLVVICIQIATLPPSPEKLLASSELSFLRQDLQNLETSKIHLEQQRIELEKTRLQDKIDHVGFWRNVFVYSAIVLSGGVVGGTLMCSYFFGWGWLRQKSLVPQVIGESTITVHYRLVKDPLFGHALAHVTQIEGIRAQFPQKAAELSIEFLRTFPKYGRVALSAQQTEQPIIETTALEHVPTPTFRELYSAGKIAPGSQLCFGYHHGDPQYRSAADVKIMAVAGWQGSGKTLSLAYIISCILAIYQGSLVYVIDPHKDHPEGLANILSALKETGRVNIVNPFDFQPTIERLNTALDQRLRGEIPSDPMIVLVIDEINHFGKTAAFHDVLMPFLSRCTEETRKANIVVFFGGHKWQARHFKNDASFRQSIPSMLVHKTKPSQAELLLEDIGKTEREMVKHLKDAGEALLVTSHDSDPSRVTVPLITRDDICLLAQELKQGNGPNVPALLHQAAIENTVETPVKTGETLFRDNVRERLVQLGISQNKLAETMGIGHGTLSKILNDTSGVSNDTQSRIVAALKTLKQSQQSQKQSGNTVIDLSIRRKH